MMVAGALDRGGGAQGGSAVILMAGVLMAGVRWWWLNDGAWCLAVMVV